MDRIIKILKLYKNMPYEIIFKENLYLYFKNNNYSYNSLINLGNELNIKPKILKLYIYKYVNEVKKMTDEEFEELIKRVQTSLYISKENVILKKIGIKTTYLWRTQEEKEYFLREIFEYSKSNNFDLNSTRTMASNLNISQSKYISLIEEYNRDYLKNDNKVMDDYYNQIVIERRKKNDNLRFHFDRIIKSDDPMIIENSIKTCGYSKTNLISQFNLFKDLYSDEERDLFFEHIKIYEDYMLNLKKKLLKERNQLKKQNDKKQKFNKACQVVDNYINTNNLTFEVYLELHNLKKDDFNNYLKNIKEYDINVYEEYKIKLDEKAKQEKEKIKSDLKEIRNGIVNGYEKNGKHRDFDILDYMLITNFSISQIIDNSNSYLKGYQINYLRTLKKLYNKAFEYSKFDEKDILNNTQIINVKFDDNKKVIEGSGRVITKEEKEMLLNYLKSNNIPVNRYTYKAIFKRYINEFISEEELKLTLENN